MIQFHPPFHLEPSGAPPSLMVFGLRQTNFGNLFLGVGPSFWKASVVGGGEIAGKLVRMQWGMLPRLRNCSTHYTVYSRVEWFSLFLKFLKTGTLLSIGYICMSSIKKIKRILPRAHAQQNFHFQKITGTLKINIFLKLAWTFFLHQRQIAEK